MGRDGGFGLYSPSLPVFCYPLKYSAGGRGEMDEGGQKVQTSRYQVNPGSTGLLRFENWRLTCSPRVSYWEGSRGGQESAFSWHTIGVQYR